MKRIYLWIFLLFACGTLVAQSNIVQYEYWLDNDYASKTQTAISPVETFNLQTTVSCRNLDVGFHTLNVRFKNDNGLWSSVVSDWFYKMLPPENNDNNTITACEYWIDNDYASKTLTGISPVQTSDWHATISCQNLSVGFHTLNARFRDVNGLWSSVVSDWFYKMLPPENNDNNTITACEYWFDDDYASKAQTGVSPAQTFNLQTTASCQSLSVGFHTLHARFKDANGLWSSVISDWFYKMLPDNRDNNAITAYEYWLNNDYSKKTRVDVAPQQTFVLLDSVNCLAADKVVNSLSYRFLDSSGLWSSIVTVNFSQNVTISVSLNYTKSVPAGETPAPSTGYSDYANVGFTLFNITKKQDITDIVYLFPNIQINQQTDVGDSILVTATGYGTTNGFNPITDTVVVKENNAVSVTFNILQHGLIRSNYLNSGNESNVGIVYDSTGQRLAQYDYVDQTLTTDAFPDGTYYLLSMAKSLNFNSIQNLSAFASTELVENTHYILQTLTVKSGIITTTTIPTIPKLDESQLSYTTDNTVFSVNKALIALNNYVTLRSAVEFKENIRDQVSDLKLIADIPANCSFVAGSVMIGDSVFKNYTIQNNQLTVPMASDSDIVHFCIIPLQGGDYAPNGYIEFTLNGKTIRQPIGAAYFKAEGLKMYAPDITSRKSISLKGIVPANSLVKVYDNDEFIGQTTALANGNWTMMQYDLLNANVFSFHSIRADVITPQGLTLQTETKEVVYDETFNEPINVTMYNTAHASGSLNLQGYVTVFDFLNPTMTSKIYWYWPNYPDFTFTIAFARNDPTLVSNVQLHVLTSSGETVVLPTLYDPAKGLWVATGQFLSNSLPINVEVHFDRPYNQYYEQDVQNTAKATVEEIAREFSQLYDKYKQCGDTTGVGSNYFTEIKKLYRSDPAVPATSIYGVWGNSAGSCFSDIAIRLKGFIESALPMVKNDFVNMPEGDTVKQLLQLMDEAIIKMLANSCDCLPAYVFTYNVPATPLHDPSGFVYEAVPSNRLQGVVASIYHKTDEGDAVLWDAAGYEQVNPQTTNEFGEYGWDVPQDVWQVKYEKEGYETAYSDWLPVPPPQLNLNIAMVNAIPPAVSKAQGYEDGIEITFSKFMQPATMTTGFITVTRNGANETGTIALLDAEENPAGNGENFVSKVRFVSATPFLTTDNVILTVDSMVLSYAGKNMTDDFVQRIAIEKEVKSLTATPVLNLIINGKGIIEISADPQDAAAGKTITARPVSSVMATVTASAVLDAEGKATLEVTGELPGSTQIIVSLDGSDVQTTVDVSVAMELAAPEQVAAPVASIPSGSTVEKNTELSLSSATEGATIRYTTDGSTPTGSTGMEYMNPIVLTENVTIQALAMKEGMTDSEIAVFEYKVIDNVGIEQSSGRTITIFVHNQTLFIRGLELGEQYKIYSVLGKIVAQGKVTDKVEQQIRLPNKGIFVVSTPDVKAKITVR